MKTGRQKLSPLQRAEAESRAGRLWRAKEILSGHIPNVGYSPETFAAYGRILLQMHDLKEAGKYLFLSGLATKEENEAVKLFLDNLRGKPCGWIFSQFPGAARKEGLAGYPERVQEDLQQLGFPADFRHDKSIIPPPVKWDEPGKWKVGCGFVGLIAFVGLVIFGIVHRISVIGEWILGK
jgi:hypothetical protein